MKIAKSSERVVHLISNSRRRIKESGVSREVIARHLDELMALAADKSLWSADAYPDPAADVAQARYLISEDSDRTFALYLNVMRPGKLIPPHNHTTWACIAAVDGSEHNTLYERIDGGAGPGRAELRVLKEVEIKPGAGIALMPDDIHSVHIRGEDIIRHLHFYGRALETLGERLIFDTDSNTASIMNIGVKTIK